METCLHLGLPLLQEGPQIEEVVKPADLGQLTCQLPQRVTVPVHSWQN